MVSKQQWLIDIENTKKEIVAYDLLLKGYEILAALPENIESGATMSYKALGQEHFRHKEDCVEFLEKLERLNIGDEE